MADEESTFGFPPQRSFMPIFVEHIREEEEQQFISIVVEFLARAIIYHVMRPKLNFFPYTTLYYRVCVWTKH